MMNESLGQAYGELSNRNKQLAAELAAVKEENERLTRELAVRDRAMEIWESYGMGDGSYLWSPSPLPTTYNKVQMEGAFLCVYKTITPGEYPPIYEKDIYGVFAGRIVKLKTVTGKVVPAQPERVEWPEEK